MQPGADRVQSDPSGPVKVPLGKALTSRSGSSPCFGIRPPGKATPCHWHLARTGPPQVVGFRQRRSSARPRRTEHAHAIEFGAMAASRHKHGKRRFAGKVRVRPSRDGRKLRKSRFWIWLPHRSSKYMSQVQYSGVRKAIRSSWFPVALCIIDPAQTESPAHK